MDLEDGLAPLHVGLVHHHLAVEASRAEKGRVEHLGAIGGGHDDHALGGVEAVHLREELIEGLLALVVAAREARGARPALPNGVELVDEDDAGRLLLGLLEQVAHPGGAHPHEHLHELGAGEEEEGHVGFPGHRAGEQGLARARRAHEEHALGDAAAQALVLLGVLEEVHDLHQLGLGLFHPRHVREGGLELLAVVDLRLGAAEGEGLGGTAAHPPHHEHPEPDHEGERHDPPEQEVTPERALHAPRELDLVLLELLDERAVVDAGNARGRERRDLLIGAHQAPYLVARARLGGREGAGLEDAPDLPVRDGQALDLVLAEEGHELAHGDLDRAGREEPALDEGKHEHGDEQIGERELGLLFHGEFHEEDLAAMLSEAAEPVKQLGRRGWAWPGP